MIELLDFFLHLKQESEWGGEGKGIKISLIECKEVEKV